MLHLWKFDMHLRKFAQSTDHFDERALRVFVEVVVIETYELQVVKPRNLSQTLLGKVVLI